MQTNYKSTQTPTTPSNHPKTPDEPPAPPPTPPPQDRSRSKMTKPAAVNIPKLKGAFKKINNLGHILNHHRSNPSTPESSNPATPSSKSSNPATPSSTADEGAPPGPDEARLLTVYVGKSRRVYRVEPELLEHPIMQDIIDRSNGSGEILIACEVVLFDHLRWMVHNSDNQVERLDDVKEFYRN